MDENWNMSVTAASHYGDLLPIEFVVFLALNNGFFCKTIDVVLTITNFLDAMFLIR